MDASLPLDAGAVENTTSTGLVSDVNVGARAGSPKSFAIPTRSESRSVQTASLKLSLTGPVANLAQSDPSLSCRAAVDSVDAEALDEPKTPMPGTQATRATTSETKAARRSAASNGTISLILMRLSQCPSAEPSRNH